MNERSVLARQGFVDTIPQEHVGEPIQRWATRNPCDQVRAQRGLERRLSTLEVGFSNGCEDRGVEFPPGDRGDSQRGRGHVGEAIQLAGDGFANSVGEIERKECIGVVSFQQSFVRQEVNNLRQEERIPARLLMEGSSELIATGATGREFGDELLDVLELEAAKLDRAGRLLPGEVGEGPRVTAPVCDFVVPVRSQDENSRVAELPGGEMEEGDRRGVRTVKIVDENDEGILPRRCLEEGGDGIE